MLYVDVRDVARAFRVYAERVLDRGLRRRVVALGGF
jgi:hypothetical protein